jgi:hypothetical protein
MLIASSNVRSRVSLWETPLMRVVLSCLGAFQDGHLRVTIQFVLAYLLVPLSVLALLYCSLIER